VIGIPGDRIEFLHGKLAINGGVIPSRAAGRAFIQETYDRKAWLTWPDVNGDFSSAPVVVPPHYIYVLNDRRSDHEDSRTWGPLPLGLFEATAARIWLSLDWYETSGQLRNWPRVRWNRLLRSID
jgi:signal peptidase I